VWLAAGESLRTDELSGAGRLAVCIDGDFLSNGTAFPALSWISLDVADTGDITAGAAGARIVVMDFPLSATRPAAATPPGPAEQ
jgi:hypothetical protein